MTTPAPSFATASTTQKADLGIKEADVLKKTSASLGLVIASALFAPLTSSPAYAHANTLRGQHGHHRFSHYSHHRNRNWNGNHHRGRIYIRIYIYNKNNNHAVAVARPERRQEPVRQDDGLFGTSDRAVPGVGPVT